jgi:AraC-like DNA-binding protein
MPIQRFKPQPALADLLDDLWVQDPSPGPSRPYEILPGPSIVLGFQFSGRLKLLEADGARDLSLSGITGLLHQPRSFQGEGPVGSVLARLKPWAPAFLFPGAAASLAGQSVDLKELFPREKVDELEGRLAEGRTNSQRSDLVQSFLMKSLAQKAPPAFLKAAVEALQRGGGSLRVAALAQALGVGQKRLERAFLAHVGLTPKGFASLLRFHRAVNLKGSGMKSIEVAGGLGYFDQAHFIQEFKSFAHKPPEAYFSEGE